ncbi:MAG: isopentenyl-diphosphate Delta-isomerase [Flavobacteriales bacterium]|jgi:isopentenyl-diphosphate delta-isomerase|nr:isopentenyl-diphosphate Delta-isomerase [Flavobacteriales bacterium]MBQ1969447.1 isopentenyl-diphosphate Delta-isomerase [Flavobacteriales bacterium]MBQ2421385.1 isopentenyl-diphosphate Delta-isomerase [Flavobacteriales bacterium]MBQ5814459.1 isopentenyl-diphosphate Delta-isomerase [Flavobacteriales bacterium]
MIKQDITQVILVDENDKEMGVAEKLSAHRDGGHLHRAFSVLVFDEGGRLMLQRRAWDKYHSQGLWTNTCCSHPYPGEKTIDAAHRRLREEMGFDTVLEHKFEFVYRATLDTGLTEYEYDHVYVGRYDGVPQCNPDEVAQWKWIDMDDLMQDMSSNPESYTVWFHVIMKEYNDR